MESTIGVTPLPEYDVAWRVISIPRGQRARRAQFYRRQRVLRANERAARIARRQARLLEPVTIDWLLEALPGIAVCRAHIPSGAAGYVHAPAYAYHYPALRGFYEEDALIAMRQLALSTDPPRIRH